MKTTVEIADPLLQEAKGVAATEGTTLRELVEDGLRRMLAEKRRRRSFRLRRATFGGEGLQPGISEGSWAHVRDLAYERRGA